MSGGAHRSVTRRDLLRRAGLLVAAALGVSPLAAQQAEGLAGGGAAGTLRDPTVTGRARPRTTPADNDAAIKQIEQKLRCTCGCNLDVFTCRTTDFTCTYSPDLHREVVALYQDGRTAQQILDAFVAKYGERVLMAPRPVDFNLVGYLLPGALLLAAGAGLAWVIGRRGGVRPGPADRPLAPEAPSAAASAPPSEAELERLRRELAEVED